MEATPPIEVVEPDSYRAVVTQHDDHATLEIQHGPTTWTTMQTWRTDIPATARAAERRLAINDEARHHGWVLPARWPRAHHGTTTLTDIIAIDWARIVADVTARRATLHDLVERIDTAWQTSIIDARRVGQLSVSQVADLAAITPPRVYQLLRESPTTKLTQTEAMVEQAKRRIKARTAPED